MKIKSIFLSGILICLVADLPAVALADSTKSLPEFRNIEWESSVEDVREQEKAKYLQSFTGFGTKAISFREKLEGLDVRIDYVFKENKLTEGSYTVISDDNFRNDFKTLKDFLENQFGLPYFRAGPLYTSDSVWIRISKVELYTGPSLYWIFNNGFISLISKKFREEISISILYAYDQTIDAYNAQSKIDLKEYKIIKPEY